MEKRETGFAQTRVNLRGEEKAGLIMKLECARFAGESFRLINTEKHLYVRGIALW